MEEWILTFKTARPSRTISCPVSNTNMPFLVFLVTSRGFKQFQQENIIASSDSCTNNTNHHWFKSLILIQLCQSVLASLWDCQTLLSHPLLNLEIIQVQKISRAWNRVLFKNLSIQHMSGWQSRIGMWLPHWITGRKNLQPYTSTFSEISKDQSILRIGWNFGSWSWNICSQLYRISQDCSNCLRSITLHWSIYLERLVHLTNSSTDNLTGTFRLGRSMLGFFFSFTIDIYFVPILREKGYQNVTAFYHLNRPEKKV